MSKFGMRKGPGIHPSDMVDLMDLYAELLSVLNTFSTEHKLNVPEKFSSDLLEELQGPIEDSKGFDLMGRTMFLVQVAHNFLKFFEKKFNYQYRISSKTNKETGDILFLSVVKHKHKTKTHSHEDYSYQSALTWCLRQIRKLLELI